MKTVKWAAFGLLMAGLAAGCGETAGSGSPKAGGPKKEEHAPHGAGPNGGVMFDLGKYHAEFTVDHDKKQCTIITIGDDEKTVTPVVAKEFTLTTKATKTKEGKAVPPMTIRMAAKDDKDGKASKFVGDDPGLGNVADFEGTVAGEIGGKPASGEFKEGAH